MRVIEGLGLNDVQREGDHVALQLLALAKRADVKDEMIVPTKYKRVTLTLPAETWELLCDSLELDLRENVPGGVKSPMVEMITS